MSVPESECPHLDTRTIHTYGWRTTCCVDCEAQWQIRTTGTCNCDSLNPYAGPWHAIGCCTLYAPPEGEIE